MMDSEVSIRAFLKELKNGLLNASSRQDDIRWLSLIQSVVCPSKPEMVQKNLCHFQSLGYDEKTVHELQQKILHTPGLVQQLCECVISKFSIDWITDLTLEVFDQVVKPIFLDGVPDEVFIALFYTITESKKKDFSFHKCVSLLDETLTRQNLYQLLRGQCSCNNAPSITVTVDVLVTSLCSLPSKMANKLQHENCDKFLIRNYIPLLAVSVFDVLKWAHDLVTQTQNVSLQMICALVGKLCITGHADPFLDTLLPHLCVRVRDDYVWNRICERVFVKVPALSLEAVLVPVLKKLTWYGLVEKFLGDSVCENSALKALLCTKLLLHRHYANAKNILQNIIGYLSNSPTRRAIYLETFENLLSVWGNKVSMRHISAEQHLYISQALMLCVGCFNDKDRSTHKDKLLKLLMPGVQAHLESSDHQVRIQGMTVAKKLTYALEPTGPQLEFELDAESAVVKNLLSYLVLPPDPGPSEAEKAASTKQEEPASVNDVKNKMASMNLTDTKNMKETDSDLDSDDDLVPYDMSNDKKISEAKPPKYVRDCMEGLICSSDNPDRTELCLKHAESLIRRRTDGLEEVSAEFAKVLLHMSDTHSFEDFFLNRFKALVALTVACPSQVAEYLTSQFYERNYSLRHRMDILEVLAAAAQELSQPERSKSAEKPALITELTPQSEPSSWREVVQKRIDSNTRRFVKGRTRPEPTPTLNRFTSVAGQFFYPLMLKVDQSEPFLDLLGQDSTLLFRLLYTLAIIVNAATNIPGVTQMGRTLLEFTWPIRLHSDQSVRQAVIIATTTVFLSVPTHSILSDLHMDITETRGWLEDVVEKDPDTECQKLAAQALLILQEQVNKEFESSKS